MGTNETLRDLHNARFALEEATLAARRSGELYKNTGTGALWDEAYEAWMQARARHGDAFALSLGYTGAGWSYEIWLKDWKARHPHLAVEDAG
jgi:hypothetical protein